MILKRLLCCLAFCLWLWPSASQAATTNQYDLVFKHCGELHFPWQDWRWWRAQGIAESGLRPDAVSPAGAIGIMQLMPETARELGVNPHDPEANICGGIHYDRMLWDGWKAAQPDEQRKLTFASYNAGPGNIARAARLAASNLWVDVAAMLARVTGKHAVETINYVARIGALMVVR